MSDSNLTGAVAGGGVERGVIPPGGMERGMVTGGMGCGAIHYARRRGTASEEEAIPIA